MHLEAGPLLSRNQLLCFVLHTLLAVSAFYHLEKWSSLLWYSSRKKEKLVKTQVQFKLLLWNKSVENTIFTQSMSSNLQRRKIYSQEYLITWQQFVLGLTWLHIKKIIRYRTRKKNIKFLLESWRLNLWWFMIFKIGKYFCVQI